LRRELDELHDGLDSAATRGVPEQYLLEVDRHRALQQAEIDWLDTLIPRIASPGFAWGVDPEHSPATRKAHRND
jgi:hypothetical protein